MGCGKTGNKLENGVSLFSFLNYKGTVKPTFKNTASKSNFLWTYKLFQIFSALHNTLATLPTKYTANFVFMKLLHLQMFDFLKEN